MTPMARRTLSASATTSAPATRAEPPDGGRSVVSMRMRVDLPAPLGPSMPKISPSPTVNEMPSTAVKSPQRLERLTTSMAGAVAATSATHGQGDIGGHPDGEAARAIVDVQADLERLDVALLPA